MLDEQLAERASFAGVPERRLECRARHADALRRDADTPRFEIRERDAIAFALSAEQIGGGHATVLEDDLRRVRRALPQLLLDPRDDVTLCGGFDDERGNAFLRGSAVGNGENHSDVGMLARGDELLDAIQYICAAVAVFDQLGTGRDRGGIGADVRLGETEATQFGAPRKWLQEALLLRVAAEGQDRAAHDRVLHAQDGRSRAVAGGDLFERNRQRNVIEAGAAVALRYHDAVGSEAAQLRERLARENMAAIPFRRKGRESLAGEIAHSVANQALRLVEQHRSSARDRWFRHGSFSPAWSKVRPQYAAHRCVAWRRRESARSRATPQGSGCIAQLAYQRARS